MSSDLSSGQFVASTGSLPVLSTDELAELLLVSCDLTLVINPAGKIVDISIGSDELTSLDLHRWKGQRWSSVVAVDSAHKVNELLTADNSDPTVARQINHVLPDGRNRLIEYRFLSYPDQANRLAIGRDFGAIERVQQQLINVQHVMEREHASLRQCETRYRVLLQTSSEALLMVDGLTERVIEANSAAAGLLGIGLRKLIGQPLPKAFDKDARPKVTAVLANAAASTNPVNLRLGGEDDHASMTLSITRFRAGDRTQLAVRLMKNTSSNGESYINIGHQAPEIFSFFQNAPDALVVTDSGGSIMSANSAFVDLVELPEQQAVVGQQLSNWLGRHSVDYQVIMTSLRDNQSLKLFRTEVMGQFGSSIDVELSAQVNDGSQGETYGFCIRNVSRRAAGAANDESAAPNQARSADQLAELVGQVPLKELVRESTEVIEQLSIEAALSKTGNNRASAAELLGVSRQSLYVKLRRYGLDSGTDD